MVTPRLFDARHGHREGKLFADLVVLASLGPLEAPRDRGRRLGIRRARERDVPLAGEQAARRVEADPPRARQEDLGPRVEVGGVFRDAGGSFDRLLVGLELDRVPRDEAGGEAEAAEHLHEQPGEVAARAVAAVQGLFGREDARLHPDVVLQLALDAPVQVDQDVDGPAPRAGVLRANALDEVGEERPAVALLEVGSEVTP
jgi:hypothetical protein